MKKLIIASPNLRKALTKLSQAINPKHLLPAATNIFCKASPDKIEFIGTDTEITIIYSADCECKETFEFLLPFEFINKIVSIYKDAPLVFEVAKAVKIKCNEDVYEVKPNSKLNEFPKLQEYPLDNIFTLDLTILHSLNTALTTTGVAKPAFEFVCLDLEPKKVTVASTDGAYIVYTQEMESENDATQQLLLSGKVIKALNGTTDARCSYNEKIIGIDNGTMRIIIVKTEHKYPKYNALFPEEVNYNLSVNKYVLVDAFNKCSLSTDPFKTATLNFGLQGLVGLNANDDMLNIDLAVEANNQVTGTNTVKVNSDKMLKLLHQIEITDVQFSITDKNKSVVISSQELKGYKALIMPLFQN